MCCSEKARVQMSEQIRAETQLQYRELVAEYQDVYTYGSPLQQPSWSSLPETKDIAL